MTDNNNNIPEQNDSDIIAPKNENIESIDNTNSEAAPVESEGTPVEAPEEVVDEAPAEAVEAVPVEVIEEAPVETSAEPDKYAFEWNYTTLKSKKKPKRRKNAWLPFGFLMSGAFLVAIIALIIAIVIGIIAGTFGFGGDGFDYKTIINSSGNGPTVPNAEDADPTSLEDFKNSTVVIICDNSLGTGIILSENGMILTNNHVIEDTTTVTVYLYDGRNYSAKIIGGDSYNDIAVIKIDAPDLTPATFANSETCYTGERVYAVGTPTGLEFAWSVSSGIISNPLRELNFYDDTGKIERSLELIQTDAPVNPGNSGGPLINNRCEVVGVVTMRIINVTDGTGEEIEGEYIGMGLAVPSNTALSVAQEIIGSYVDIPEAPSTSPQIGITGVVVTKGEKFRMNPFGYKELVTDDYYNRHPEKCIQASNTGVYVIDVSEGFDAYGKLQAGDIIIRAGNSVITSMETLKNAITSKKVGDTLNVTVVRNGKQHQYAITLGKAAQ